VIPIHESFEDYVPPRAARRSIERLLSSLPAGRLAGLESVVLTSASTLGQGKTRRIRGRKYREKDCLGFYHPASSSSGPWIELVVDNIVRTVPSGFFFSRYLSDLIFASTVFHEVGHHLDATIGSPSKTGEAAADSWASILGKQYFLKRYRVLARVLGLLSKILRPVLRRKLAEAKAAARPAG
jgi:hypothetical protein